MCSSDLEELLSVQSGVDTAADVLIEAVPIEEGGADTDAGAAPTPAQPPSPGAVPATPAPPPAADAPKAPGAGL